MSEITFEIRRDEANGWFTAVWDDPQQTGGIATQGRDLNDLQAQVTEGVAAHFDPGEAPRLIRFHQLPSIRQAI
jgi:hypothetical protein